MRMMNGLDRTSTLHREAQDGAEEARYHARPLFQD